MSSCSDRLLPPIEDAVSGDKILNADSYQIISFALKKRFSCLILLGLMIIKMPIF